MNAVRPGTTLLFAMAATVAAAAAVTVLAASGAAAPHDDAHGRAGHTSAAGHDQAAHKHAAALGRPGDVAKVSRTIEVDMTDAMRFNPAHVDVKRGETIRFVVRNSGKVRHEMVLGSAAELKAHAEAMRKSPQMQHADPNQVVVDPGKTGELVWQFTRAGRFDFACLQPGHFEAGMVGKVVVK